jgi:hypothetical protein
MVACLKATAEACFPQLLPVEALGIFYDGVLVFAHPHQLRRPRTLVLQAPFQHNPRAVLRLCTVAGGRPLTLVGKIGRRLGKVVLGEVLQLTTTWI